MKSLDTNLLLYALDETVPGHEAAKSIYVKIFQERETWIIADQVLFELYRALRNSKVLAHPLPGKTAIAQIEEIRSRSQAQHVAYDIKYWDHVMGLLGKTQKRKGLLIFDVVLAVTLYNHGVKTFYTRNVKDFISLGLFEVVDPLN